MINKYYVWKLKKLLEKNTYFENNYMGDTPTPYIMTDEKDYYKMMNLVNKLFRR